MVTSSVSTSLRRSEWSGAPPTMVAGQEHLARLYQSMRPTGCADEFLWEVMSLVGIDYQLVEQDAARVPRSGGAVVIAGTPLGAAQGLVVLAALRRLRPDVKVMASNQLQHIPELAELTIGGDAASAGGALREAVRWVRGGGVLLSFLAPASHARGLEARLAQLAAAPLLPLSVHLRDAVLFQ